MAAEPSTPSTPSPSSSPSPSSAASTSPDSALPPAGSQEPTEPQEPLSPDEDETHLGPAGSFAAHLRDGIARHGRTLDEVRAEMARRGHDLSITTLSYWQNGRSLPTRARSLESLADLERLLDLEVGSLLDRAQRDRRPRRRNLAADTISADARRADEMSELALDLGLRWEDGLERVSVHSTLTVDADGGQRGHTVRQSVRARRFVEHVPVAFSWDHPDLPGSVEARVGCHLGRVRSSPSLRVLVAELVLDPPLPTDAAAEIEFAFVEAVPASGGAPTPVVTEWELGFMTSIKVFHRQIRFHPDRLPSRVFAQDADGEERLVHPIEPGHVSDLIVDSAPGSHLLRWEW